MKFTQIAVIGLIMAGCEANRLRFDEIWGEVVEAGVDANSYLKNSPKGYTEKEKPKPDPKKIANEKKLMMQQVK